MSRLVKALGVTGVTTALCVGFAAPASAEYFFTESGAERVTKDAVHKRYGYSRYELGVSCRPQGARSADSRFKYHRWVCTWAAPAKGRCDGGEETIFGQMLLVGRSGPGAYTYKITKGAFCDNV